MTKDTPPSDTDTANKIVDACRVSVTETVQDAVCLHGWVLKSLIREALATEREKARRETFKKCLEIARNWKKFSQTMQDKSKHGEKDGMYRMFAAEDIERAIDTEAKKLMEKENG